MLLSFLDFSFVTHLTWPSHVTCDTYYIDPNPSSVCFQRQHQGKLCPSSNACSNSTYNTNNIVLETEGRTGTNLLAGRDILPNEIIAVFSNVIILQDRGLVQEFTKLINTYNMDHPTRGFQYSIFYPVAGDSYPLVVIPDLDRKLAHGLPNLSKQLRSRLRHGSSTAGLAHLANPHHRNSELQILSVWQEDRTSTILQGSAGDGSGVSQSNGSGQNFGGLAYSYQRDTSATPSAANLASVSPH